MLPTFIIIGAMKAGTTSLHYYLSLHPEIFMSETKELNFFIAENTWGNGIEWYEAQFPTEARVRGESSPDYTKHTRFQGVAARMHAVLPDAKLVYVVRDPIDRIVSHFIDSYSFRREHGTIDEALADLDDNHYVNCSKYYMQLEQYFDFYPKSSFLVIASDDLKNRRLDTLRTVFRFLEVDDTFVSPNFDRVLYRAEDKRRKTRLGSALYGLSHRVSRTHLRRYLPRSLGRAVTAFNRRTASSVPRPTLSDDLRARLVAVLEDDVARLSEFTGRDFPTWSVPGRRGTGAAA